MIRAALPLALALATAANATEYDSSLQGRDTNPGTREAPFRTIQRAADVAQPGDTVTVHEGIYRERVNPPRGGLSDTKRIVYPAAPGEKVEVRGSEVVSQWTRVTGDVWTAEVDNTLFGAFNPFADEIRGDWFDPEEHQAPHGRRLPRRPLARGGRPARRGPDGNRLEAGPPISFSRWARRRPASTPGSRGESQRTKRGAECASHDFLSGPAGQELPDGARLHHAPCGHALGSAHRRADRG